MEIISPKHLTRAMPAPWLYLGFIVIVLAFILSPTGVSAQSEPESELVMTAIAGLDGFCKLERWMPVRVTLENTGADLDGQVEVRVTDGFAQWRYGQQVALPAVSRKEVTVFAFLSGSSNSATISFLTDKGAVSQTTKNLSCVQSGTHLVGVWAASPSVYNIFTTLTFAGGRTSVAQLEMADIPSHSEGLDMLNMLVISDVDTGPLSDNQRQALIHWVENGGRLVVVGGPGWQKTAAGLGGLLPLNPGATITLPDLSGLTWFSPDGEGLEGEAVAAIGDALPSALVLASQDDTPLILRHKIGFGDVYFLAADPALAPLRNWTGTEQMYQNIFSAPLDIPSWTNGFLAGFEASTAVSNVPGLGLPSIVLICGFLGLYILALGPLNYLVLRYLKRRELAWISIPFLVIVFSLAAYVLGLGARGIRPIINHLSIVQVWPEREQASVHGLVGVFSPSRSQYDIEVEGNFLAYPLMDGSLGGTNSWLFLQNDGGTAAEEVRIDVGGIEAMAVSGQVPAPDFSSNLSLNFSGSIIFVQGQVTNNSQLTLRDAVIVGPGQVQKVGDFHPGDQESVTLRFPSTSNAAPNTNASPLPAYSYDTTLDDFFGTSYMYNNPDQDLARRFSLMQAALGYGGSRGGGIYLLGWTDSSPLAVNLGGTGFRGEHTSMYILALTPNLQTGDSTSLTLPPSLFTWSALNTTSYSDVFPYNSYLYEGTYSFRFQLNQAIPYQKVTSLTLHLTSYGVAGDTDLLLSLWDFTQNQWEIIPAETWGDHSIAEPEKFVGYGGEIRLQIESPSQSSIQIERSDFTLVVEP